MKRTALGRTPLSSNPAWLAKVNTCPGVLSGVESEAVESITAKAYSAVTGPVGMTGNLTIALPREEE